MMDMLTEWVGQIILFILFASIVDMLLPQNSFRTYAKVVISLLLISILLSPLLKLFQIDAEALIQKNAVQ
ncbi:stage III sporulation protein AF [Bacillaceae bacterium SIJ1]|uniref:stage III sporulation protein AF n=1 Tax=Litoribacterium kuwaitense TaxID=1398745 RepID=UPI0013EE17B8|nr:stage III sporulation protein AF [Litoribacterium kuwaitense]NGP43601.1 stage III sporulation protein AF [Litoribacterium kuwaitense]